jgi:predicted metalloprotease with PDZ domain
LTVTDKGVVDAVAWNGPAFRAGLAPRTKIVAVQGQPFSTERLLQSVRTAGQAPVTLTIEQDGLRSERAIPYGRTLRYPHLARIEGSADTLTWLLSPR